LEVNGLLLDTHALLWTVMADPRLTTKVRAQIEKVERLAWSMVSLWEIALKLSRPGFDFALPGAWHQELTRELREMGAVRVEITAEHCRRLQDLPWHHKDPFDRMLIAQAQVEGLTILSADRRFKKYDVKVLW
jgi:PIN domain nuclease of toxin-antitoxin system